MELCRAQGGRITTKDLRRERPDIKGGTAVLASLLAVGRLIRVSPGVYELPPDELPEAVTPEARTIVVSLGAILSQIPTHELAAELHRRLRE
jgi:hypothetical protein